MHFVSETCIRRKTFAPSKFGGGGLPAQPGLRVFRLYTWVETSVIMAVSLWRERQSPLTENPEKHIWPQSPPSLNVNLPHPPTSGREVDTIWLAWLAKGGK